MTRLFYGRVIPSDCNLVGHSWLINQLHLQVPVRTWSCVSKKRLSHHVEQRDGWTIYDSTLSKLDNISNHLEFALKHQSMDLVLIKRVLQSWGKEETENYVLTNKKGLYQRKIWFLYETLLEERLEIDDLETYKYENILNDKEYFTNIRPVKSKRHKINNNLLGVDSFCPIVRKTEKLTRYVNSNLSERASRIVGKIDATILRRAASFLLLADSKASFEIEGERPASGRIERWGKIINQAGRYGLSVKEIERLHAELLYNSKTIRVGIRKDGVFLGERDREGDPVPEFIGAKEDDLQLLIKNWLELDAKLSRIELDPIIYASIIAFSFVYIHPLEDGNGRIHRYLIHHILGQQNFYPKGMIFPISAVILDKIENYRNVLTSHSGAIMECIDWRPTAKKNVAVLNDTADFYRYFDCTKEAEFIFECAEITINDILPKEIEYIDSFDNAFKSAKELIEIADHKLKQLIAFIVQNNYQLSKNKRDKYFENISDVELRNIESIVKDAFMK